MESADIIADTKKVKNWRNSSMRSDNKIPHTYKDDESFERLRNLFLKTEEMKAISQTKNEEMENQFRELQERLSNSSGFLNQMKKSIENIKFSYQRDIEGLERMTKENRNDIDKQIEELRTHIKKIHAKAVRAEKPEPQNYQEAFSDVLETFQNVAQGKCTFQNES
ncbi:hypothetical protein BDFB_001790 [Asbolus verrucosus]|uniref:Uncharacterized protein n=1 Tax=Asbolus verrucosus TaxID=1661398 RepID=A0A482VI73_ASBVE|nr:hypothetical protein BDFB_001790 [Asbolus verrucosus]